MEEEVDVPNAAVPCSSSLPGNNNQSSENVCYNLGQLKREEDFLRKVYLRMSKQLHKLEVEELELKQCIRKKEMQETDALLPPAPTIPEPTIPISKQSKSKVGRKRRSRRKYSMSTSETTASEFEDNMSASSSNYTVSPLRKVATPTRRSARLNLSDQSTNTENYPSKSALKASKALILPDDELPTQEPLHLDIDLSALNALPVPEDESEEEETDD